LQRALARVAGLGDRDVDDAAQPGYGVLLVYRVGHVEPPHAVGHVRLVVRSKYMVGTYMVGTCMVGYMVGAQ
jgi:hypothetical protein